MTRSARISGVIMVLAAAVVSRSTAQSSISDILIVDSLTPAKMQLRDYVAQLRDTLTMVESIRARITRANASGMNSVVLSSGRQLGRSCHASVTMIETTEQRVGMMKTSDVRGDQALASFRAGLATLADNMRLCQRDDSVMMVSASPDRKRIQQVATAARDAIMQYDQVRDALLRLLGINLPVNSYVRPPQH